MTMETTFHIGSIPIGVSHEPCSTFGPTGDCHIIVASDCEPNTLTRIKLRSAVLYVHWEKHEFADSPHVLFLPETSVLFFGAGTLAVTVRVPSCEIVDENVLHLFWAFERKGDFVVQLGDIECNLYTADGRRIATAAVDPPYDVQETPKGVKFRSEMTGVTWLRYPSSANEV